MFTFASMPNAKKGNFGSIGFTVFAVCYCLSGTLLSQTLALSEFQYSNIQYANSDGEYYPWLEINNNDEDSLNLAEFAISQCLTCIKHSLPEKIIEPGHTLIFWISEQKGNPYLPISFDDSVNKILLFSVNDSTPIDSLIIRSVPDVGESIGKTPDSQEWIYYPFKEVSFGLTNPVTENWRKVLNHAPFPIGDAGTYSCLVHHNQMYFLDYETRDEYGVWTNLTDIWRSSDGMKWELVNNETPYGHNSTRFVSYSDSLFAFDDGITYKSYDGKVWVKTGENSPTLTRVTIFKNSIYGLNNHSIYKSQDGSNWNEITNTLPWTPRSNPAFIAFKDKLWVFGGGINYNSGNEIYFQDVWNSEDGINWSPVTHSAPWEGNIWFGYNVFDNKLWYYGGYNWYREAQGIEHGNSNKIWWSEDGREWAEITQSDSWGARHAPLSWVHKDALWIASGYGGGGIHRLYNDVWKFEKLDIYVNGLSPKKTIISTYGDAPQLISVSNFNTTFSLATNSDRIVDFSQNQLVFKNAGLDTLIINQQENVLFKKSLLEIPIEVRKKNLMVTRVSAEKTFMADLPKIEVIYDGFANEDNEIVLDTIPVFSTAADRHALPGNYPLVLKKGKDNNYNFSYGSGFLTVIAEQSLIIYPNPTKRYAIIAFDQQQEANCKIFIYNSIGRSYGHFDLENSHFIRFDLRDYPTGQYFIKPVGCSLDKTQVLLKK